MNKRIVLPLAPDQPAMIKSAVLPVFKGDEPFTLVCGGCKEVLGEDVSPERIRSLIRTNGPLVIECPCGAHNLLPSKREN